jgi:hypothetical protein
MDDRIKARSAAMTRTTSAAKRRQIMTRALALLFVASVGAGSSFYLLVSVVPLYAASEVGAGLATGALMLSTVATEQGAPAPCGEPLRVRSVGALQHRGAGGNQLPGAAQVDIGGVSSTLVNLPRQGPGTSTTRGVRREEPGSWPAQRHDHTLPGPSRFTPWDDALTSRPGQLGWLAR